MRFIKELFRCVGEAIYNTVYHDGIEFAGYLAFLFILSLFPFLILFAAMIAQIAPLVGGDQFWNNVVQFISSYGMPKDVIDGLRPTIVEIVSKPPQGMVTISLFGALWTSSAVVEGMRTVLNRACRAQNIPTYAFRRFLSMLQIILIAVVTVVVTLSLITLPVVFDWLSKYYDARSLSDSYYMRSFIGASCAFMWALWLYWSLPNAKQYFLRLMPGAILLVILWYLIAEIFSYYLRSFNQIHIIYGGLAGIVASMFFFYLIGVCFIFCAELNYSLANSSRKTVKLT